MLSPGQWYKLVPTDPLENLKFRKYILEAAGKSRNLQKGLVEICRQDIVFYINTFVYQTDPRKQSKDRVGPFICWDFQIEALLSEKRDKEGILWCIEHGKDLAVEKSRDMGATWLFLIVSDWLGMFEENHQTIMMSKSADAVESDSPNSLFWKIDFIHRYLPRWLMGGLHRRKMHYGFEKTGSTIDGEASTGRAGVGGRSTEMFIDEFPQIKEAREVHHRTSDTTNCRLFNGTHLGVGTVFHELCTNPYVKKIQMHWSQHPEKKKGLYRYDPITNKIEIIDKTYPFPPDYKFVTDGTPTGGPYPGLRSPYYDEQCRRKDNKRAVAMDLDIDPLGSASQFFDAIAINSLIVNYCTPPIWQGDIKYDADTGEFEGVQEREGGPLKLWARPDKNGRLASNVYVIGADISTGSGATPSCLSGVNCETGEKVLQYTNAFIDAKSLAPVAKAICQMLSRRDENDNFKPATIAWEIPGPGQTFGRTLVDELHFRQVYYRQTTDEITKNRTEKLGWNASPQAKLALLENYRMSLATRQFINFSEEAMKETLLFEYDASGYPVHGGQNVTDDPSGARINHGDHVIADALACMLAEPHMRKQRTDKAFQNAFGEQDNSNSLAWRRRFHENMEKQRNRWT